MSQQKVKRLWFYILYRYRYKLFFKLFIYYYYFFFLRIRRSFIDGLNHFAKQTKHHVAYWTTTKNESQKKKTFVPKHRQQY